MCRKGFRWRLSARVQKILLIEDHDSDKPSALSECIEAMGHYTVARTNLNAALNSAPLDQAQFTATVLDCDFLNQSGFDLIQKISTLSNNRPILIAARQIALQSYREIDRLRNAVAIQKDFKPEIFQGMLAKMSQGADFKPSICSRFLTDEEVRVMVLHSGLMVRTRMRNYSAGGLFMEYRGISLAVGDKVRVSLPCPDVAVTREYLNLNAKVVWERKLDARSPVRGVGLQFV